jgi:hypothetical protein
MPLFEEVPMFFEYLAESVPVNSSDLLPLFSVHLPFYHDQVDFIEKKCKFLYDQVAKKVHRTYGTPY